VYRFPLILAATLLMCGGVAQAATPTTDGSSPAPTTIADRVTHVPASTLNAVGLGGVLPQIAFPITKLRGSPLLVNGKPDLLTFIDEWCPHCAADSWALAIALSRFGTLSGLREFDAGTLYDTKFPKNPPLPHVKGLSFFHTIYTSSLLSFTPVILQTPQGVLFKAPTAAQKAAIGAFDPKFNVPVSDFGGLYGMVGSPFVPNLMAGLTWSQIAGALASPTNKLTKQIDGSANLFSAAFCQLTKGKPVSVCTSAGVTAAAARLPT
jgi:hypothetical protein